MLLFITRFFTFLKHRCFIFLAIAGPERFIRSAISCMVYPESQSISISWHLLLQDTRHLCTYSYRSFIRNIYSGVSLCQPYNSSWSSTRSILLTFLSWFSHKYLAIPSQKALAETTSWDSCWILWIIMMNESWIKSSGQVLDLLLRDIKVFMHDFMSLWYRPYKDMIALSPVAPPDLIARINSPSAMDGLIFNWSICFQRMTGRRRTVTRQ